MPVGKIAVGIELLQFDRIFAFWAVKGVQAVKNVVYLSQYGAKRRMDGREIVFRYVADRYGSVPEYLWADDPFGAILRHTGNRKWYAVVMRVSRKKLGLDGEGSTDIVNVKCDPVLHAPLCATDGIFPAYHMNKRHWLTALLDGTVPSDTLGNLLDMSFALTAEKNPHCGIKSEY